MSNLIDKAIKYGYKNTTIKIYTEETNDMISLNILNYGIGISELDAQKIFDKFYRFDSSRTRKTGGVGLGLSVVKSINELHKGKLEVVSTPQKETIFKKINTLAEYRL